MHSNRQILPALRPIVTRFMLQFPFILLPFCHIYGNLLSFMGASCVTIEDRIARWGIDLRAES